MVPVYPAGMVSTTRAFSPLVRGKAVPVTVSAAV